MGNLIYYMVFCPLICNQYFCHFRLTLVLRRGVATTVFVPVLKNQQPMDKIAPGTFNFILFPNFSKKKSNLPPIPGEGKLSKLGGRRVGVIL